ncbi:MAG: HlyD family secretion protein [Methylovirgula sp.]|uniref:HlyD family secretion protein n=1 Tax=Methylovirgula sp. TaxID=1978224 RepID=UPI003076312E
MAARTALSEPRARAKISVKRLVLYAGIMAALTTAGWYGYDWWRAGRFIESTDDAYVGGDITPIAPHVSGFIAKIAVTDNQHVAAGQLLVELDDRDYRAAADHAQAVLDQHKAALNGLHAQYALQQSTIAKVAADLDAKKAQAIFAKDDAARYRHLALTDAGTSQDAQRSVALDQQSRAAVASAQASLEAAKQQLAVLDANIGEAQAAVAQATADLDTAHLNLGYTVIRSPIEGFVGNRAAQIGSYVAQGAYLLTIVPARGLWVDANFKEDQLAHMGPRQRANVIADILPGHVFHGHVESLSPGTGAVFSVIPPENATGNFTKIVQRLPVRIALDPDDSSLVRIQPGLSTTVSIDTRTQGDAH